MHRFVRARNILATVTNDNDCDVIVASGAWGDGFLNHYFNHIQRNHKLCLDKITQKYEYVFYTMEQDYNKHKHRFIIPDITFIFMDRQRLMGAVQLEYAYKREKPIIFMSADCLYTVNLLPNLLSYGYDACCTTTQRVCYEIIDRVREKERETSYEEIFQPREFLKLVLPALYPTEKRYFMDSYKTSTCNGMFWPVRKDGILVGEIIRAFHFGVVYVKRPLIGLDSTCGWGLDSNPFLGNLATPDTIGIISDSDDGFLVDVSTCADVNYTYQDNYSARTEFSDISSYFKKTRGNGIAPVNESLMGYNVAVHSVPLNQEWLDLAKNINDFVTKIYNGEIKNKELNWRMYP